MTKFSTLDARRFVEERHPFTNHAGSLWGDTYGTLYIVYSYGTHWPLYVFKDGLWYGNADRRSRTTAKHKGLARPAGQIAWWSTDDLQKLIAANR